MHFVDSVLFSLAALTTFIGLSFAFYATTSAMTLERGTRHGRYRGLGAGTQLGDTPKGGAQSRLVAGVAAAV